MTYRNDDLALHVWGPFACFTRPEYATERVSYPIITPPAAVGLLSSVFWKPEFDWLVTRIWLVKPPQWVSMTKNEVKSRASTGRDQIDVLKDRVQRHSLFLREVEYVVFARPVLRAHATEPPAKYRDQLRRRAARGSFFSPPYLGLRELTASFGPADLQTVRPTDFTLPVGPMSLDLGYDGDGATAPEFFNASIEGGVLDVPLPRRLGGNGAPR